MYMGDSAKTSKKVVEEIKEFDHTIVPDWLSGHSGAYNFDDWTVETLLVNNEENEKNEKTNDSDDMKWGFENNDGKYKYQKAKERACIAYMEKHCSFKFP